MNKALKRLATAAAALALCLLLPAGAALADGGNLLVNGSFEDNDGSVPAAWVSDCWNHEEGFSVFTMDPAGGPDGSAAACIENAELNDARLQQDVEVEKGKLYRLSGDIRAEGASGWGANLSFKDTFTHSGELADTGGQWKHVELYARAGRDQTSTTVYLRLGGYSSETKGRAWFDNVVLEQVDSLPEGATEGTMATSAPAKGENSSEGNQHLAEIILVAMLFGAALLYAFKHLRDSGDIFGGRLNGWLYVAGILTTGNLFSILQFVGGEYDFTLHVLLAVVAGLVPALIVLLIKRRLDDAGKRWMDIAYVGFVALAVRVFFAVSVRGYPNDIACWLGWGGQAASNLFGMYREGGFNDYPPGYMYVLFFLGKINYLLPFEKLQWLVVKLPSMLCDLGTAWLLWRIAEPRTGRRTAGILALLYLFNPLVILDSSAWGQIDSILTLFVLACFWQAYRGNLWKAALLYGLGLLVKPQMLLFGPVMLGALIVAMRDAGGARNGALLFLKTVGAGLAGWVLPALPFIIAQGDPLWLPKLYFNATGTYNSASVNACNLLALFGGNWVDDAKTLFGVPYAVIGYTGMAIACVFAFCLHVFRDRSNRRVMLWAAVVIAGIFVLGVRMHERYMFPAVALLLAWYATSRDRRALYLFGMFSITQFLNVAMVLANKHMPSDRLDVGGLFAIASPEGAGYWTFLVSLMAVVAFGYMAYAAWQSNRPLLERQDPAPDDRMPPDEPTGLDDAALSGDGEPQTDGDAMMEEPEASTAQDPEQTTEPQDCCDPDEPEVHSAREERRLNGLARIREDLLVPREASRIRLSKKDWLLMGALTLVYAIVSLLYLGTTQVPQTMWPALHTDDYAVVDFGQPVEIGEIWHYDSLTKGNLIVSSSMDGEQWTDQMKFTHKAVAAGEKDDLGIYSWTVNGAGFTARYVRLRVTTPPVRLLEIVFKDGEGNILKPAGFSDAGGSDATMAAAANLTDEPQMTPERPSFFNSTYFDEIYHARTGWEFTQGLMPYENTHPPLGKDLIALGITIFGMNPFGWRFMGTLMGILMVPAMYLFGMAVFRRTRYAFIASFLFTFDFMHFVQTRIATIDSYAVLFIILTFLFMFLYLKTNYNTQGLRHTLLPLALSGVTFGLAAASKWIGLYAGTGLAVIFFYSLYRRWREYEAVRRGDVVLGEETRQKVLTGFARKTVLTVLWCGLFFVVVSGVIYFASYIPFNIGSGGKVSSWSNFKYAWDNQAGMYNYHSRLVDNHYFKSPWYQWPLMVKPMWFYKADYLQEGWMGSIATFGNPAVWWPGTLALAWLVVRVFRNRRFRLPEAFLLFGFLTEFLPWVLVPRTMFIYHYFASVPFFVMAIVLYIREWEQKPFTQERNAFIQAIILLGAAVAVTVFVSPVLAFAFAVFLAAAILLYGRRETASLYKRDLTHLYMAVALALFILFYPALSGLPMPSWYGGWLSWMPSWWFI